MPQKLTVRELRAYLKSRTQEELANDIAELFSKLDAVRDYYTLRLLHGFDEELLARYKLSRSTFKRSAKRVVGRL